jgi:hypothetical protein|tara:strand:- start:109 stop:291 length:183 start_codon:yes stop_codon:yes gene_type:complete
MTDIEKYKSVAIKIDAYKKAKPMAEKKYMSMGSFIRYLIDKEEEKPTLKNGEDNHVRTTD